MRSPDMQKQKAPVSFQLATRILESFGKRGLYEESVELLTSLLSQELTRKEEQYTKLHLGKAFGFLHQHPEAKKHLFDVLHYFEEVEDFAGRVECLNHLAFTFLRNGELREAKTFLHLAKSNPVKSVYSTIIQQMIFLDEKRYQNVFTLGEDILKSGDTYCVGIFYNNLGVAFNSIGEIEKSIENYEISKDFFVSGEYFCYTGIVENNLAMCYLSLNNFRLAQRKIENAIRIFDSCKNRPRLASALDTQAQIYFTLKDFDKALSAINKSISILRRFENVFYLLTSYETKIRVLVSHNSNKEALQVYGEAFQIAKTCGEEWLANFVTRIAELFDSLPPRWYLQEETSQIHELRQKTLMFPEGFKLDVNYFCVEIRCPKLKSFGLLKGDVAIVAETVFNHGDLVAVCAENGKVSIGILSLEFDLLAIEIPNCEPIVFERTAKILGKVIGTGEITKFSAIYVKLL